MLSQQQFEFVLMQTHRLITANIHTAHFSTEYQCFQTRATTEVGEFKDSQRAVNQWMIWQFCSWMTEYFIQHRTNIYI